MQLAGGGGVPCGKTPEVVTDSRDDLKIIRNQNDEGKKVDYLLKEQVIGNSLPEILIKTIRGSAVLSK